MKTEYHIRPATQASTPGRTKAARPSSQRTRSMFAGPHLLNRSGYSAPNPAPTVSGNLEGKAELRRAHIFRWSTFIDLEAGISVCHVTYR